MLYYKCPSCRTVLANKQLPFEDHIDKICKDNKLTDQQKTKLKEKLLDKLFITNICCRMRMLTYIKEIELIK
jgi:DNA-directed RNA polymerase subunit N (RpoN/RPB10)